MAERLGTAVLELTADGSQLDKDVEGSRRKVAEQLEKAGAGMVKAGKGLTVGVTAPILAGFGFAVNAASNLNESVNAVNQVFGEGADKIHEFGAAAAKEAGLSQKAFNELVTPVGAMLRNVGFGADEAADASINLAQRAADMASVFNTDVDAALGAIQAGLRGEADPLERFGVGLSAAAVEAHALSLGLAETTVDATKLEAAQLKLEKATAAQVKAIKEHGEDSLQARDAANKLAQAEEGLEKALEGQTSELTDNQKAQARLSLLMKQTDRIAGDFAATSGEVANAERITKAEAENAAAALGQNLIPAKAKLIEVASQVVGWFNRLTPAQQENIVKYGALAAAVGPVLLVLGRMVLVLTKVGQVAIAAGKGALVAGKWIASTSSSILGTIKAYAWLAGQYIKVAAQAVASAARQVAAWAMMGVQSLLHAAKVAAAWLLSIWPIALVIAAVVGLAALIVKNWDKIVRFTVALWAKVKELFVRGKDAIVAAIRTAVDWLVANHPIAILLRISREVVPKLLDWFRQLPDRILGALGNMGRLLVDAGRDLIRGLINGIKEMAGRIADAAKEVVKGAVDGVKSFLGMKSPSKLFEDIGIQSMQGTVVGFEKMHPDVTRAATDTMTPPRLAGAGAGAAGVLKVLLSVDGRELAEALGPPLVEEIRPRIGR